jgi:protein SCO1
MRAFDGATPVEDILAYVDRVRAAPALRDDLVGLLPEQAPIYAGRSANEAERIRGYMLASFETTGLPPAAIDYVLEELESGLNPYAVAAAAKAMRGAHGIPERAAPLLLQAIDRIRFSDDFVGFERGAAGPVGRTSTTALMELFRTLAWLGPRAGAALGRLQAMPPCRARRRRRPTRAVPTRRIQPRPTLAPAVRKSRTTSRVWSCRIRAARS